MTTDSYINKNVQITNWKFNFFDFEGSNEAQDPQCVQTSVMTSYYLVKYYGGSYEDSFDVVLFATSKKTTATKYCTKFNKILKKWKDYYKQFETQKYGIMTWIADEYINTKFERWNKLNKISKCCYVEVLVR